MVELRVGDTGIEPVTSSVSVRLGITLHLGARLFSLFTLSISAGLWWCGARLIARSSPRILPGQIFSRLGSCLGWFARERDEPLLESGAAVCTKRAGYPEAGGRDSHADKARAQKPDHLGPGRPIRIL
jgi:hypothetical protein